MNIVDIFIRIMSLDLHVSLLGGFEDKNGVSKQISNMILSCMATSNVRFDSDLTYVSVCFKLCNPRFILCHACIGSINTRTDEDGHNVPRVYGGGVDVGTGQVFAGTFSSKVCPNYSNNYFN